MKKGVDVFAATCVPKFVYASAQDVEQSAQERAQQIISDAQHQAALINAQLDQREREIDRRITDMTDSTLRTYIDEQKLERTAKALTSVMQEASNIRIQFESLTPWVSELVATCLDKVVGELDEDDLLRRVVRQAISELSADTGLILRVPPLNIERMLSLRKSAPSLFVGVLEILPDKTVPPGEMRIEGSSGMMRFGLERGYAIAIKNMERAIAETNTMRQRR